MLELMSRARERVQVIRVAALERIFILDGEGSRYFRHEMYAYIAQHEANAWGLCATHEQRESALIDPKIRPGSRPSHTIVQAWDSAFEKTFGVKFIRVTGSRTSANPNGVWCNKLAKLH